MEIFHTFALHSSLPSSSLRVDAGAATWLAQKVRTSGSGAGDAAESPSSTGIGFTNMCAAALLLVPPLRLPSLQLPAGVLLHDPACGAVCTPTSPPASSQTPNVRFGGVRAGATPLGSPTVVQRHCKCTAAVPDCAALCCCAA